MFGAGAPLAGRVGLDHMAGDWVRHVVTRP
jgi:hypothetical protein